MAARGRPHFSGGMITPDGVRRRGWLLAESWRLAVVTTLAGIASGVTAANAAGAGADAGATGTGAVAATTTATGEGVRAGARAKPNILFIVADQWRAQAF